MRSMVKGVGLYHLLRGKSGDTTSLLKSIRNHVTATKQTSKSPPVRATMVSTNTNDNVVVLVEEWATSREYDACMAEDNYSKLQQSLQALVSEPPTIEYFPEVLHICCQQEEAADKEKLRRTSNVNIGILVQQKTSSAENGGKLRDAQREAYERQMTMEPGCTCCIILANSEMDPSQVRIIELWRTLQDFSFHESSDWHALGEEKVVPLVVDMDCDFCTGIRLL